MLRVLEARMRDLSDEDMPVNTMVGRCMLDR